MFINHEQAILQIPLCIIHKLSNELLKQPHCEAYADPTLNMLPDDTTILNI